MSAPGGEAAGVSAPNATAADVTMGGNRTGDTARGNGAGLNSGPPAGKELDPMFAPPLKVVYLRHLDVGLVLGHLSEPRLTLRLADLQGLQLGS